MNTDGTGFSLLHTFTGGVGDGGNPYGSLTLSGSTLYGTTSRGGSSDLGTVFKMNTDGTGFYLLHNFAGGNTDGRGPADSLTLSLDGSTLYGMTPQGGSSDLGTVFKMKTDGSDFKLLYSFTGGTDGRLPGGSLTLSLDGSTLYGMTSEGGSGGYGTVFQIKTDGSGFKLLHEFSGSDGGYPYGSLTLSLDGFTLYGMTSWGGSGGYGTVFQIKTDGSGFRLLHEFSGSDGGYPYDSLTLSLDGSTLYGMTSWGGSFGLGTVFSIAVPEPGISALLLAGLAGLWLLRHRVPLR
jgi:uncharacterized repeat protein (TIGR03803 family)